MVFSIGSEFVENESVTKLEYQEHKTNVIKYTEEKKRNRICIYNRFKYNR